MVRALYSLLMYALQPLLRYKLWRRARNEPGYGVAVHERFGRYASAAVVGAGSAVNAVDTVNAAAGPCVWVHAVSLGETRAAAVLVAELRVALPGMRLLLTHGTATGRAAGAALLRPGDVQVWQPWDTPTAVARLLRQFRPRVGLLMETEVWPNLVAGCARAGVPLCLVNARLSERSLRQSQRWGWLARPAFAGLAAVWAQTQEDAQRLRQLGAPAPTVVGNLKFDAPPNAQQLAQGRAWRRGRSKPVVLFASSRETEERLWLDALAQCPALAHSVQWLIVPRHPQRFDAVAELLHSAGLQVLRRSAWAATPPPEGAAQAVWLGDSLGEMPLYFGLADMALLGGSFAPLGGQNLIEAAACDCPVVMGSHTFNFAQAAALASAAGAAWAVADMAHALEQVQQVLQQPQALQHARRAAQALVQAHQGAARRTAQGVAARLAR